MSDTLQRALAPIRWLREIFAVLSWFAALIQVFVFDMIGVVSRVMEIPTWLVTYRSLLGLSLIILLWLTLGNKRFIFSFGYILVYPLVVIGWHIPRVCFRNWPLVVAFSPALILFLRSFRFLFAVYGSLLISASIIFLSDEKWQILLAMFIIGSMLIVHYFRQMKTAFAAKSIFADTADAVGTMWQKIKTSKTFVPPVNIDPTTKEGEAAFGGSLITMYFFTAGLGKVACAMRSVADSRKLDFLLIISWCLTVCLTIIVFAFLYLGLEKVFPQSFENAKGLMSFLGYSICVMTTSDLSHIQASSDGARIVSYLELGCSILVLVLMFFLILTSLRDRYRDDLARIADELENTAQQFENLLNDNYKLTIQAAEEWLLSHSLIIARHILRLRLDKDSIAQLEAQVKQNDVAKNATIED